MCNTLFGRTIVRLLLCCVLSALFFSSGDGGSDAVGHTIPTLKWRHASFVFRYSVVCDCTNYSVNSSISCRRIHERCSCFVLAKRKCTLKTSNDGMTYVHAGKSSVGICRAGGAQSGTRKLRIGAIKPWSAEVRFFLSFFLSFFLLFSCLHFMDVIVLIPLFLLVACIYTRVHL